jgi:uncharacterized protein YjiS (DUF1127 family)
MIAMPFFNRPDTERARRERKLAALRRMSAADLADIGLKPGDLARLEREIEAGR